jgi:UDP-N-acetylmuramoyl-tripeptide--D-alanyl-D-alanine ligase
MMSGFSSTTTEVALITLNDILEALTNSRPTQTSRIVSEAVVDSRQAIPGALFIALPGERVDGHEYLGDAFKRGAHLALVQNDVSGQYPLLDIRSGQSDVVPQSDGPLCLRVEDSLAALQQIAKFWRRKLNIRVIGITGSVGKSTTKELVSDVLNQRFPTLKNAGNLNNEIGLPLTILRLGPDYSHAVLEMGFYYTGEIAFLCDIALPHVGVITNIGTVHAERAGSQEAIAKGKAELVKALPTAPEGTAVLNFDDPWVRPMAKQTHAKVFYYGLDPHAELWADEIESRGLEGIRFKLHFHGEMINVRVPLIGRHSVHTALRAAAVGLVEGLTWEEIIAGLQRSHMQLRMVTVHTDDGALILDDTYNASPESTLAALNLLDEMSGHKIAVLGDMLELGPYEKSGHEMVGMRAAEVCNELITVGIRGRMIAEAALVNGMPSDKVTHLDDVLDAVGKLRDRLKSGDVVLVKGSRGLHMERITSALERKS